MLSVQKLMFLYSWEAKDQKMRKYVCETPEQLAPGVVGMMNTAGITWLSSSGV